MINNRKVVVVLPAYDAALTLARTYHEIPLDVVDEVVLVDDASRDGTVAEAQRLGIQHVIKHDRNLGYGGNQKTCYAHAMRLGADIIVMLHPDYQYSPKLILPMASMIATGLYPVVLGSRILGGGALSGGMPRYKYISNRVLTAAQNLLMGQKLSEYHTGYRAFAREVLERVPFEKNSDDFVFDNQIIAQIFANGYTVAEITCPTKYFTEASSISFRRSVKYGCGVLLVSFRYFLDRMRIRPWPLLRREDTVSAAGRRD